MQISPSLFSGLRLALPVMLGYIIVAFAFGILAVQAGFTPFTVFLMSFLVFAGSAQLIAVSLVMASLSPSSIILTVFIINLRHLLMSAAMAPHLASWPKKKQAWFAFEMTDETFAINLLRALGNKGNPTEIFTVNTFCHWSWIGGSVLGALFGNLLGDIRPLGLDFALPGMFIALLLPHLRVSDRIAAVFFAAVSVIVFALLGAAQWSIILATVVAATLAIFLPIKRPTTIEKL